MTNPAKPSRAESGHTWQYQKEHLPGSPDSMLRHPVGSWRAGMWVGGGYLGATMQEGTRKMPTDDALKELLSILVKEKDDAMKITKLNAAIVATQGRIIALDTEAKGMEAENKYREAAGQSIAYTDHFFEVADKIKEEVSALEELIGLKRSIVKNGVANEQ